jgi:hypothetical protein
MKGGIAVDRLRISFDELQRLHEAGQLTEFRFEKIGGRWRLYTGVYGNCDIEIDLTAARRFYPGG